MATLAIGDESALAALLPTAVMDEERGSGVVVPLTRKTAGVELLRDALGGYAMLIELAAQGDVDENDRAALVLVLDEHCVLSVRAMPWKTWVHASQLSMQDVRMAKKGGEVAAIALARETSAKLTRTPLAMRASGLQPALAKWARIEEGRLVASGKLFRGVADGGFGLGGAARPSIRLSI